MGRLEEESSRYGYVEQVLVLTPVNPGGVLVRVERIADRLRQLLVVDATLDEIAKLDRADYRVRRASEERVRRRKLKG